MPREIISHKIKQLKIKIKIKGLFRVKPIKKSFF